MDRWNAEMGRVREEKRRRKKIKKRKSPKKEDPGARKGRKVAKHCVFPMICGSGGSKVGSLKRWVRSQLARCEMKNCTPLWREAHFEVKMYKTHHARSTFGSWDVEKVHADFEVKMLKTPGVRTTFGSSDAVSRGRRKGLCTGSKVSKMWGFCSISKNDGRRGTFEEDLQRWISRGRRSTRDIRDVSRSGRWFPERGCILEHQIVRFAKMVLRDRCSTSYDLASLFRGRRSTLDR